MGLQLSVPIATARSILNDPDAVRYSAADMLGYANDGLDQLVSLLPHLFYTDATHTCTAADTRQSLSADVAISLVAVRRVQGGNVVHLVDKDILDLFSPGWRTETAAAARNWCRLENDPRKFLIYPQSPTVQVLEVTYVAVPGEYAAAADTGLPTVISDALSDYIVYRAESRDDEHVNSNRAAQFMASFLQKVKG